MKHSQFRYNDLLHIFPVMNPNFMKGFAQDLIGARFGAPDEFRGCSQEEIAKLESYYDIRLPETYRQFLSVMGHQAGSFYKGTDCFYSHLFDLRKWLEVTLTEDRSLFHLTKDVFVFSIHQGYIHLFFYTIENNNNPAVWGYCEGEKLPKLLYASFSDFLLRSLEDFKRIHATHGNI